MKFRNSLLSLLVAVGLVPFASATVTINIGAETLRDSTGGLLAIDGLVLLVGSTDTVFSGATSGLGSLSVGSSINGSDDVVLWRGDLRNGDLGVLFDTATVGFTAQNDSISLYWFPTLTLSNTDLLGGESYGFFTDALGHDGSDTWLMPSDGGTIGLNFITADASVISSAGSFPNSAGWANYTVTAVPEPSTYAAVLGGLVLGVVGYRRYRRK